MSVIETRLQNLRPVLPGPAFPPGGIELPFPFVRVFGHRAFISGHPPQNPDRSLSGPFGKVGQDVTVEETKHSARLAGLSILGSLQRELGYLDRVTAWLKVLGMASSPPDFKPHPLIIKGFTVLIPEVFGPEVGRHARSAVRVVQLPFDIPVEIEGEVEIR